MANLRERQQVHQAVLRSFVETGHAPHYTELAETLGIALDRARQLIHETAVESPFSFAWVTPDTDFIGAWAPFSNLPNHNVITVEGVRLHGQWGLESLAVSQLFPGKEVAIESRCVQSGEPIRVRMLDSEILEASPETTVAHANVTMDQWGQPSWAFTWARMNLFRSEEDVRAWADFDPRTERSIKPVREWAAILCGTRLVQKRLEDDFVERSEEYGAEALTGLGAIIG